MHPLCQPQCLAELAMRQSSILEWEGDAATDNSHLHILTAAKRSRHSARGYCITAVHQNAYLVALMRLCLNYGYSNYHIVKVYQEDELRSSISIPY